MRKKEKPILQPATHILCKGWLIGKWAFIAFGLLGCSHQQPTALYIEAPTLLPIANPAALSDAELNKMAQCEYWGVCLFEKYEKLEAFGPNSLFEDSFHPTKWCRAKECERLKPFYYQPLP